MGNNLNWLLKVFESRRRPERGVQNVERGIKLNKYIVFRSIIRKDHN